jgi:hypothetical protein
MVRGTTAASLLVLIELIPDACERRWGFTTSDSDVRGRNLDSPGNPLGVAIVAGFRDVTFHGSWQVTPGPAFLAGRGFARPTQRPGRLVQRPGYKCRSQSRRARWGTVQVRAIPTGQPVCGLASERLLNYETGLSAGGPPIVPGATSRNYLDPIVRRTLRSRRMPYPPRSQALRRSTAPDAQQLQRALSRGPRVSTAVPKVTVNDGRQRYWGIETRSFTNLFRLVG